MTTRTPRHKNHKKISKPSGRLFLIAWCVGVLVARFVFGQIETVESGPARYVWVAHGRIEGHLALSNSPAAAFSPDGFTLAVASGEKIVLMDLARAEVRKVLNPHIDEVTDLEFRFANFIAPNRLFLLGSGLVKVKEKGFAPHTPLLAFQWDTDQDTLTGKINQVGGKGGYGAAHYFPEIGYLTLYKEGSFELWNPSSGRGGKVTLPDLTRQPNVYAFSRDGQWLLLAQIEASSTTDPLVVKLKEPRFVDALRGHQATVLGISFSRDSQRVVTACEDGKVRVYSVPDWNLARTLSGHQGPVHWAEFSPDGNWIASAGEDTTLRIWSGADGKLEQVLEESKAPLRTVSFSPNGEYVAASAEQEVLLWRRRRAD